MRESCPIDSRWLRSRIGWPSWRCVIAQTMSPSPWQLIRRKLFEVQTDHGRTRNAIGTAIAIARRFARCSRVSEIIIAVRAEDRAGVEEVPRVVERHQHYDEPAEQVDGFKARGERREGTGGEQQVDHGDQAGQAQGLDGGEAGGLAADELRPVLVGHAPLHERPGLQRHQAGTIDLGHG